MATTPDKGSTYFLDIYLKRLDLIKNLDLIAQKIPNIDKWTNNNNIDNKFLTSFCKNPRIKDSQKTCFYQIPYWTIHRKCPQTILLWH